MRALHSMRALVLILAAVGAGLAASPTGAAAQSTSARFTIVLRGVTIGSEDVTVERTAQGTTISSIGRFGPPVDLILRALQIRYDADGRPLGMTVDASARSIASVMTTTVDGDAATSTLTPAAGDPVSSREPIAAGAVLLPNPFVAPYEALAQRLRTAADGSDIPVHQPGGAAMQARVGASTPQQIQTLDGLIRARQTAITFTAPNAAPIALEVWADDAGRLLRVKIPTQQLDYLREDLASVSARLVTMSRPNDEDVRIDANGFSLAGTLSKPSTAPGGPLPAVLLVSGANQSDRDEVIAGVPIFGQIAESLANSGMLVLRYDKRGIGQSGGRADAATLTDFAEDAKAALNFLRERKDVDRRRIAIVGHSEGGWVALLAAAGNGRVAAVGLLSTAGMSGANLNLFQVERTMNRSGRADADRQQTLALQRQIQQAVITGKGWEEIRVSSQQRRQAETAYFQSFLTLDPPALLRRVDQPLLILQGELDRQLPPDSAGALEAAAAARKNSRGATVVRVPGVNHLLVPARSGEVEEYGALTDHTISPVAAAALIEWLKTATTAQR